MYDFIFFTDVTDSIFTYKAIGAYKVAHILRENGYSVLVVDHLHTFSEEEFKELLDSCVSEQTKCIGFSSTFLKRVTDIGPDKPTKLEMMPTVDQYFFPQGPEFEKNIIQHLHSINANCKVLVGGVLANENIQNKLVDYAILGFGEQSILRLAKHLVNNEPLENVKKNLWGVTILDDKLAQGYDFQNSTFQWEKIDVCNHKILPIEISRGCIFKCSFCSYPLIGKKTNDYIRTAEILAKELQDNYDKFGVYHYYVLDDTFNDNDYKLDALLTAVKKLTFQPLFWAYTRLDLLTTRKHVDKLYDIGLRSMYFGIETLNPATGRAIKKGHDREKQIKTVQDIRQQYGNEIKMNGNFIIGLPHETLETATDTFKRLKSGEIPLHSYRFNGLILQRPTLRTWSSELARNYKEYGYQVLSEEHDDFLGMKWTNEHFERDQAWELANKWTAEAQLSDNYYISDQAAMALINYGYTMDWLRTTKYKDINWQKLEQVDKFNFINDYKKQLFAHLKR